MARTRRISALLHALVGGVALFAALALAAPAPAQDPAEDQYTPTKPGGGGPVPTDPADPDLSIDGEKVDDGSGAAAPGGSGGTGGSDGAGATADQGSGPSASPTGGLGEGSDAERTLEAFAQQARDERAAENGSPSAEATATDLRRSDGDGTGLGVFLWVALGLTLLWAVAARIIRGREAAPLT